MTTLRGAHVLVTRPRHQNQAQIGLLKANGAAVIEFPLLRIEDDGDPHANRALLNKEPGWDAWIVTSANAASRLRSIRSSAIPEKIFTLGNASGSALGSELSEMLQPSPAGGWTSEALLAEQWLQQVKGKRILICSGLGGRGMIEHALRERGASVQRLNLYRRIAETHAPDHLDRSFTSANACIVTSGEGLERLHLLCPPKFRMPLLGWPLVVPSVRVIEIAQGFGHRLVEAPTKMSDAALVDCLSALWRQNSGETAANSSCRK